MEQRFVDISGLKRPSKQRDEFLYLSLEKALKAAIQGEVRFDNGSRALYATDASNYRQVPIGVVIPKSVDDVIRTVRICHDHDTPVLSRGGGTSLAGQCCNVAVVIDFSKYVNRIIELDPERRIARVEPGVVLDDLRDAAEHYHLTFAPDPATHNHNTLGGMIGNNSCGVHSVMGGETVHNVIELDVLTYDGVRMTIGETDGETYAKIIAEGGRKAAIYQQLSDLRDRYADEIRRRFPQIPRRVSGYNLEALLPEKGFNVARSIVGSEGTCVVILGATLRLVHSPPARSLLVLGYNDVYEAGDHAAQIVKCDGVVGLEGIDDRLIDDMKAIDLHPKNLNLLPEGGGWLLVEFGDDTKEASDKAAVRVMEMLKKADNAPSMKLYDDPAQEKLIWQIREAGLGATAHVPDKKITWEGWEDSAVPPERLGDYLRQLRQLFQRFDYACDLYGHFGQGCVHTRIDFDLESEEGIRKFREFIYEAANLVVSFGGSISGEHGDGQSKAELLPIMFGEQLMQAFREFKYIWDPKQKMNPGKVVDAYGADENLRLGANYRAPDVNARFHYPEKNGDFPRTILRCVGVGECRKKSGTMCPSYKVTGEEMHSTRGRARLLFEMLRGDPIKDAWKSEAVKAALDLCLSCKGCKGECPVNVDMATYKAEFLAHYYESKRRPLSAYTFGWIDRWARLASFAPSVVNFLASTSPFKNIAKTLVNIPVEREIPLFARETFRAWFNRRPIKDNSDKRVLLWADTFNNYWHPHIAQAAVAVLESAGFQVKIPSQHICCGRPLYEFGMIDRAKHYLQTIMDSLADDIDRGTDIVVLEPACATVFLDELASLFPGNERAKRLKRQTFLLSDFLMQKVDNYTMPSLTGKAIVHGHCHHKSIIKMNDEETLLRKLGLDIDVLDSGCCGMAGSFGFEKEKYDVSIKCAERVLLPAVRNADDSTLIIADGYSCREQIMQTTGKRALHLAEVLHKALGTGNHR